MMSLIEKILNDQVRPALAQHGGNIELIEVKDKIVYIKFYGGCHGCSSSDITLKNGIEQLIKQHFPEILEVIDLTDHQSGTNPFM